jgi:beta-barrel assembly-enhancing protease
MNQTIIEQMTIRKSAHPSLTHFKRSVVALLCAALMPLPSLAPMALAQNKPVDTLPSLGDPASADLSPAAERKLGEKVMRELKRDPDYLSDPQLTDYLNRMAARLTEHLARYAESGAPVSVEVFGVRDRAVNAFALPGGYIGIHTGLMMTAKSESELASVMAHEISHVSQRHIARSIAKQSQYGMAALAATILGILAASRNPDAAQAVIAFGTGAAYQGQLNFSRDMEREADRIGFSLLSDAQFSSPAMLAFFERLQTVNRINDSGTFPYLRSHPLTSERIGDMRTRLGSGALKPAGVKQAEQSLANYADFALMTGRARVLTESSTEGVRSLRSSCQAQAERSDATPVEQLSALYCAGYASAKLRDTAQLDAQQARLNDKLKALPAAHAARTALALLQAESAVLAAVDNKDQALAALKQISTLRAAEPLSRPVALLQGEAALASRNPDDYRAAREGLLSWVSLNRQDATAWGLLGRVQSALGENASALRASAEGAMLDQQWRNAIDMLERARKAQGISYFDASIIDARMREARERMKEEMDETRGRRSTGANAPPDSYSSYSRSTHQH